MHKSCSTTVPSFFVFFPICNVIYFLKSNSLNMNILVRNSNLVCDDIIRFMEIKIWAMPLMRVLDWFCICTVMYAYPFSSTNDEFSKSFIIHKILAMPKSSDTLCTLQSMHIMSVINCVNEKIWQDQKLEFLVGFMLVYIAYKYNFKAFAEICTITSWLSSLVMWFLLLAHENRWHIYFLTKSFRKHFSQYGYNNNARQSADWYECIQSFAISRSTKKRLFQTIYVV